VTVFSTWRCRESLVRASARYRANICKQRFFIISPLSPRTIVPAILAAISHVSAAMNSRETCASSTVFIV
jgi:hypothetical protein